MSKVNADRRDESKMSKIFHLKCLSKVEAQMLTDESKMSKIYHLK